MSVLAYSELLKRIAGIEEKDLEAPFRILSKNNTTSMRLEVIKGLARYEPMSTGMLLQKLGFPRGGGSYITIQNFFSSLEKEELLERRKIKSKTLWAFSNKGELLKRYILS